MQIIAPIRPRDFPEFLQSWQIINHRADWIEIWLDQVIDPVCFFKDFKKFKSQTDIKFLAVCKRANEKGDFDGTEDERLARLSQFIQAGGDAADFDVVRTEAVIINQFIAQNSAEKLILSFHDYQNLADNIELVLSTMQGFEPLIYKFAMTPQSKEDLELFYKFTEKDFFKTKSAIFTTMGRFGIEGREYLKSKTWGGFYAIREDHKTASGQPCLDDY